MPGGSWMKGRIGLILVIVFLSGTAIGFFSRQLFDRHRLDRLHRTAGQRMEEWFVERLTNRLSLRPEQVPLIRPEVWYLAGEIDTRRTEHQKDIQSLVDEMMAYIRPMLDEKQRHILDRMTVDDLTKPGSHRHKRVPSTPSDP